MNPLVVPIGKMQNSVSGWIQTGFAKARLAYAIGVNAGMKTNSGDVNGTGGRTMKMPLFERIRMWWYRWVIRHVCHHTYDCCMDFLKDCRKCPGRDLPWM